MIRYLIKNNFKLMLRNKWAVSLLILCPILIVGILASAFNDLLKSYENVETFSVGYSVMEESTFSEYMPVIKTSGEEAGLSFVEYAQESSVEALKSGDIAVFVEFGTDTYTIYKSEDHKVEGISTEYFMHKVFSEMANMKLQTMTPEVSSQNITIPVESISYMPDVDSKNYYGIAYCVFLTWIGIICAIGVISSEKKNCIARKYQVSTLSSFKLFMSLLIPVILTVLVCMSISTILSTIMYDISWGNLLVAVVLFVLNIVASSAFGLMLVKVFDNMVSTIIMLFLTVWFMGFFGGSFETYMFSSMPDTLKHASPIYHITRALVENSIMGESEYIASSIIYTLIVTVSCTIIAMVADGLRKRGKA
ncbi:MAG: ABC transporter permease [Lachnospiraceae bacterium]|nr:ABC transporter permease [Lachnospiraceae bacterium]